MYPDRSTLSEMDLRWPMVAIYWDLLEVSNRSPLHSCLVMCRARRARYLNFGGKSEGSPRLEDGGAGW